MNIKNADFLTDEEKMRDFKALTKDEFLVSYSYLTEEEYDNTDSRFRLEKILCDLNRAVENLACYVYCKQYKVVPQFDYSFRKHIMRTYYNF